MVEQVVVPLLVTLAIEVPIVALVFRDQWARMATVCLITTGTTNVLMNTGLFSLATSSAQYVLIGELGAVTIEAAVYAGLSRPRDVPRAVLASALANAASFAVGLLL